MRKGPELHRKGVTYSALMHALFLLFAIFGLPSFMQPDAPPQPMVIAVDILPISEVTNAKPNDEPLAKEEKPEPQQQQPTPPTPPVKHEAPPPPPAPEPAKESAPIPLPTPEPWTPKKDEKKPEPKKEEKKPEPKKPDQKKATEKDLEAVLKSLKNKQSKEAKESKDKKAEDAGTKVKAENTNYDPGQPLSMSEMDAIRSQIAKYWSVPAGAKDAFDLKPTLRVQLNQDGSLISVELADSSKARYASDPFFRAAADSAMRAVRQASPLQNLPADKYQTWRDIEMTFDPKNMLF